GAFCSRPLRGRSSLGPGSQTPATTQPGSVTPGYRYSRGPLSGGLTPGRSRLAGHRGGGRGRHRGHVAGFLSVDRGRLRLPKVHVGVAAADRDGQVALQVEPDLGVLDPPGLEVVD